MKQINQNLIKFFSELGMFNYFTRTGPKIAKLPFEEYLSAHVLKATQIAFILAHLENVDPEKTACIVLFHDNGEIRCGDQNKIASRYFKNSEAEKRALEEQSDQLPKNISTKIKSYFKQYSERSTKEGIVAQDADWLEQAIFAKEMVEKGHVAYNNWIANVEKALETKSAKAILEIIKNTDNFSHIWWQGLKKMTYTKLTK